MDIDGLGGFIGGRIGAGARRRSASVAGTLLQQALEKYLKGYLMAHGWRLRRTHNLLELLKDALDYDPSLEAYHVVCDTINGYYQHERYPNQGRTGLTVREVQESLELARPLIDLITENFS